MCNGLMANVRGWACRKAELEVAVNGLLLFRRLPPARSLLYKLPIRYLTI
jgi:hypothetical protein